MIEQAAQNKVKTLFMGSGVFAIPILESLLGSELVEVSGIVTQPDRPAGRGRKSASSPLFDWVSRNHPGLTVYQPERLRDEAGRIIEQSAAEFVVVAAYGQMVPQILLEAPKYKALNIHGSLLPDLRGAVPVQTAILRGYDRTGVTVQLMVKELDAGPVLAQAEVVVLPDDTSAALMRRLAAAGAELLAKTIPGWISGTLVPQEQDHAKATYTYQADISKEKAELTYETPVETALRMVRAFNPWPVAWFTWNGKRVRVFSAAASEYGDGQGLAGNAAGPYPATSELKLLRRGKVLYLRLADGEIELLEIQLEGKQVRKAEEYLFLAG